MHKSNCFHCGSNFDRGIIHFNEKAFCCNGCKTVYEILNRNDLVGYYEFDQAPGAKPEEIKDKYNYLDNKKIASKLYDYVDEEISII